MKTGVNVLKLTVDATLHQIVEKNKQAPGLLKSIGLNPERYADKTLRQVCAEKQWNEMELLHWIKQHEMNGNGTQKTEPEAAGEMELNELCRFLEKNTLSKITEAVYPVRNQFSRVHKIHGIQYPWLKAISWDLGRLLSKLDDFVRFETETFYPLAIEVHKQKEQLLDGNVQKARRSLQIVLEDHKQLENRMNRIAKVANGFRYDESACSTLRILCVQMKELFSTVQKHLSAEQEKLIPELKMKLAV